MDRKILSEKSYLNKEIKDLENRLEKIKSMTNIVSDTVQNGYKRRAVITGIDFNRINKIKRYEEKLQKHYDKLLEMQNDIEDYIETIKESKIRQIFRYRYIDNMNWLQIQIAMGYRHEDKARKIHDKFLKENL